MLKSLILPLSLMLLTYFYSTTGVSNVSRGPVVGISAVVGFPAVNTSVVVNVHAFINISSVNIVSAGSCVPVIFIP